MREIKILLIGGLTPSKFKKAADSLTELLEAEGVKVIISTVNIFEQKELSPYEDQNDIVINVGTGKLGTKLPVINGMSLLYPWMGQKAMVEEILSRIN